MSARSSDIESYAVAWRARFGEADRDSENVVARMLMILPDLARHLAERYGVKRIWVFGSVAENAAHDHSDIDLAVEGLPEGAELFRAGADLEELGRPFRIDLVPIEDCPPSVRKRILERGRLLYERP